MLCELSLWGKHPTLKMVTGKAPAEWNESLWTMATDFPRIQKRKDAAEQWMSFFSIKGTQNLRDIDDAELEDLADKIWKSWLRVQIKGAKFQDAKAVVTEHLKTLNASGA